jgi:hypothetical protein
MPYITLARRDFITGTDEDWTPQISGELNYILTKWVDAYLKDNGLNYRNINDVIGALECCKLELYRRVAAPYEDKKRDENGEVYSREILP